MKHVLYAEVQGHSTRGLPLRDLKDTDIPTALKGEGCSTTGSLLWFSVFYQFCFHRSCFTENPRAREEQAEILVVEIVGLT